MTGLLNTKSSKNSFLFRNGFHRVPWPWDCSSGTKHFFSFFFLDALLGRVFLLFFHTHLLPASGEAMATGVVPSPPRFLPSIFIAHRARQSHCSSIFHRVLLTHALALSASQFVHKRKSQQIYKTMHSGGVELKELSYTRLEDNLIRHRGDRLNRAPQGRSLMNK